MREPASMDGAVPGLDAAGLAAASFAVARRCAAGATIWCVAPSWPAHARHVAVEFVHPVIIGKRALPAVAVGGPDAFERLRLACRSGDVVVGIATAADPTVARVMRHAAAWGAMGVWIGAGPRPSVGAADHVLWCNGDPAAAVYGGGLVLRYHLLWELTHVCLEQPAVVTAADGPEQHRQGPACSTCSDDGRVAEVLSVDPGAVARVRTPAGVEEVDVSLVAGTRPGDLVLLHAGTAISLVEGGEERPS